MKKITVGVSEDHTIYRNGLVAMLKNKNYSVIITAENGKELLEKCTVKVPDIVILDYLTPELNGIQTTVLIKKLYPKTKILILSMFDSNEFIVKAIESGANGYLVKDDDPGEIILAIQSVMSIGYYLNDRTSKILINQLIRSGDIKPKFDFAEADFTVEERQIIQLLSQEYSTEEIAEMLHKSKRTIDGYRSRIMKKTGAKNVVGIIMFAVKHQLIVID